MLNHLVIENPTWRQFNRAVMEARVAIAMRQTREADPARVRRIRHWQDGRFVEQFV